MSTPRWHRRFDQYRRMLALLTAIEAEGRKRALSDAEKAGLVQFFEMSGELGWKTLADILRAQLLDVPMSPLPVVRHAFAAGLIADGERWIGALEMRNLMSHAYEPAVFEALVAQVGERFLPMFEALSDRLLRELGA